jgi:hypothetical protein
MRMDVNGFEWISIGLGRFEKIRMDLHGFEWI